MWRQTRLLTSMLIRTGNTSVLKRVLAPRRAIQMTRDEAYQMSISDPEKFWGLQATRIDWFRPFDKVLTLDDQGYGKWFEGGQLNTCYNAIDRHVHRGHGDRVAIIYDSPVTNTIKKITYRELLNQVSKLSAYLKLQGVEKGDRVVIYMPNIPEAAVAMLACARLGAVHSVVFGGFAAHELAVRIVDCTPKVVISASCGIDGAKVVDYKTLLDQALEIVQSKVERGSAVQRCVVLQRPQRPGPMQPGRDVDWETAVNSVSEEERESHGVCVPVSSTHPLYLLYTSGTTGAPKGVQRDTAGHAVALAYSMEAIYNVRAAEVMWAASDVGWVVGHSYGVYGPLLTGSTTLMYEGKPVGTPDAANFWRTIARHRVKAFFTAPTAIRAIKRLDPQGLLAQGQEGQDQEEQGFDLSCLSTVHLAGEHADKDTIRWLERTLNKWNVAVRDHWWQTETGWAICADSLGTANEQTKRHRREETVYGSTYWPSAGYDLRLFDPDTQKEVPVPSDETHPEGDYPQGHIFLKLPLPPGCLQTLYNAADRFSSSYLTKRSGFYDTGDAGFRDPQGRVYVMARTDDVINVAGHRLSSGALEEAVCLHSGIAEAAVVGLKDSFKGQVPLGLVVLHSAAEGRSEEVVEEVVRLVRDRVGPVASFKHVAVVKRLPKTRSGKTLRAVLRQLANHEVVKVPATIEDPAAVDEVAEVIKDFGERLKEQGQ